MGLIVCERHGNAPILLACPHIRESLLAGEPIEGVVRLRSVNSESSLYYCIICATQLKLPTENTEVERPIFLAKYDAHIFRPACWLCFQQFCEQD
jgi:hypothetical protein